MTKLATQSNGIDTDALQQVMEDVKRDPATGIAGFEVKTGWKGGTRSETRVERWSLGGRALAKNFTIAIDEPHELLGENTAPNPQEYLFAAINACMMATYVAAASMQGIELEHLEIETRGELDLRGFLGLDNTVSAGYDAIDYTVRVKGNGTPKQFAAIHEWVKKTSPNYFNMANAIGMNADIIVE
ncbi:MAG: OsmC family protein [Planctomycetota bacterium]|jgi:uncharacterized OsmC-like protein